MLLPIIRDTLLVGHLSPSAAGPAMVAPFDLIRSARSRGPSPDLSQILQAQCPIAKQYEKSYNLLHDKGLRLMCPFLG